MVGSWRPQRESNPGPPPRKLRALPNELPRPPGTRSITYLTRRLFQFLSLSLCNIISISISPVLSLFWCLHFCQFLSYPFALSVSLSLCLRLFPSICLPVCRFVCFCLSVFLCLSRSRGAVAQSVERLTPGEDVLGSITALATSSLLVGRYQ